MDHRRCGKVFRSIRPCAAGYPVGLCSTRRFESLWDLAGAGHRGA